MLDTLITCELRELLARFANPQHGFQSTVTMMISSDKVGHSLTAFSKANSVNGILLMSSLVLS